jgi:hypothetical protein
MAGVQVTSTGVAVGATGVIVAADGTACCCGAAHNCAECGDCCFSDASTIDVTWDLSAVTSSLGDAAVGHRTGSESDLPYVIPQPTVGFINWYKPAYLTTPGEISVLQGCLAGHTSEWLAGTNGLAGTDHYEVEIAKAGGATFSDKITTGDCCGFNGTAAIRITHRNAANDFLGQATGTGTVTIVVNNNLCCRASAGVCNKVSGNCDGTCPSDPGAWFDWWMI